jgi:tetratricopeptide (TPR) repeat protein
LQEALAPLKKAAEQPTARRSARVVLAETYFQLGQAAEAEAERRRAADAHPDLPWPDPILDQAKELRTGLQPRIDQALVLLGNNQVREAGALITQALRDHPDSDEAHLTLGRVLIKAGEIDRAQVELLRAVQLNPGLVEGHFLLAGTQMVQKDYEAAERSYLRAVELKPMHGLAHYNLGECRLARGNRAGAVESFRDAVRCRPDLVIAHLKLGELLLQDGRADEAAGHLADAVRLDPANDQARRLLDQARAGKKP